MSVTATNLLAGPATLYVGLLGATEPLDTVIDTAPSGTDWRDVGGTSDGVTLTVTREYMELEVDQIAMTPERRLTKVEYAIATNLAEGTLENLAAAWNALEDDIVTGTGVKSLELSADDPGSVPNYAAIILDGRAPGGFRRRIIARKVLSTDDVESAYKRDEMTLIPVTFTGHWVSASIKPLRVIDETA